MALKEKLIEHVKQLPVRVTELDGVGERYKENMVDFNVELRTTE